MSTAWHVRLAHRAEKDFVDIVSWTAENFGPRQAAQYAETITLALEALHHGPEAQGARAREDIGPDIRILHVARQGRKGRHFVVYRAAESQAIDVLRLLHDSMDVRRHLTAANDHTE